MLGIDPRHMRAEAPIPRGWHFALFAGQTPRHSLRSDGFPGLGVAMPQLDRPRLLLGQRSTVFHGDFPVGASIRRHSAVASVIEKTGKTGPLSIVRVEHSLSTVDPTFAGQASVQESQTYYLAGLPDLKAAAAPKPDAASPAITADGPSKTITPDDLMLFQYSALGFNTHRIHFDRDYAQRVEGHPDLVVNGGLASLLAMEYLRVDLGMTLKSLTAKHLAPLYANRPLTLNMTQRTAAGATLNIHDCDGKVAAELVVTFDDL